MAFVAKELAVMAFADIQPGGHRWFAYANIADDLLTAANFFLPFFVITDLPITEQTGPPPGALGDLIYDVNNRILYAISVFTIVNSQVTAVTVAVV